MNVFSRNWVWSSSNRLLQQIQPVGLSPQIDDLDILKFGNIITIEVPESITSGVIQIHKQSDDSNFNVINNLNNIMILEEEVDFYQLTFGNLEKSKNIIRLQADKTTNELFIDYEIYSKDNFGSKSIIIKDIKDNKLYQNYPNPFKNQTSIQFDLIESQKVSIFIYNIKGEMIKKLDLGEIELGQHTINWDGTNDNNDKVSSGIYFYQLRTKFFTKTKKMTFIKSEN